MNAQRLFNFWSMKPRAMFDQMDEGKRVERRFTFGNSKKINHLMIQSYSGNLSSESCFTSIHCFFY